jgi:hypothetical protein
MMKVCLLPPCCDVCDHRNVVRGDVGEHCDVVSCKLCGYRIVFGDSDRCVHWGVRRDGCDRYDV